MSRAISVPGIEDNYLNFNTEIKSSVQGRYKWEVLYDPTTSILSEENGQNLDADPSLLTSHSSDGWSPNLILDSGLDKLARMAAAQVSQWCEAGTGYDGTIANTKPTKVCYNETDQGVYVIAYDATDPNKSISIDGEDITPPWDKYPGATALAIFVDVPELTKEHERSLIYWQGKQGETDIDSSGSEKAQFKIKFVNTYEPVMTTTSGLTYQFAVVDVEHTNYKVPGNDEAKIDWYKTDTTDNTPTTDHGLYKFYHFFTQQTELHNPYKMSQFYVEGRDPDSGSIFCGTEFTTDSDNNVTEIRFTRTYDFYMELTPVTYTELGFMESPAADTLFSRIVLDEPIHLVPGQFLRVSYQLVVTPTTSSNETASTNLQSEWGGNPVQIGTEGGWESASGSEKLKGLEKIQHIGMCIVTDSGVAEPYDESGLSGEIFSIGSSHFGPGYGYPNRWRTGTLSKQHKAPATIQAYAVNPFTGNPNAAPSDSVSYNFGMDLADDASSVIGWEDTTTVNGNVSLILNPSRGFLFTDSEQTNNAIMYTQPNSRYYTYNISTGIRVNQTEYWFHVFHDIEPGTPFVKSQQEGAIGYLSNGFVYRPDLEDVTDTPSSNFTLNTPNSAVSEVYTGFPSTNITYDQWKDNVFDSNNRGFSDEYKAVKANNPIAWYGYAEFSSLRDSRIVSIDNVDHIKGENTWIYAQLYGKLPTTHWSDYGSQVHARDFISINGGGRLRCSSCGYNERTYLAQKSNEPHSSWVGGMFNVSSISNTLDPKTNIVYYAYRNTSHTIKCNIDLTSIEMKDFTGNLIKATGGGKNIAGAKWENVGGKFLDNPNKAPTIKAEIVRRKAINNGLLKNGVATDRLGQKLTSQAAGHQLSIMPKSFFDLGMDTFNNTVTGGTLASNGVTFYDLKNDDDWDAVFGPNLNENGNPISEIIDISSFLEFEVTVNIDGTINIENTKIDRQLYNMSDAISSSDGITLHPTDTIRLTLQNYDVAGKIQNGGPVWEYAKPDENPHILGGDVFSPPYLRPIYQNSPLKNYLPRMKDDNVFVWKNGAANLDFEHSALTQWTNLSQAVGQHYEGAVRIGVKTEGGSPSSGGNFTYVKPAVGNLTTYYNDDYVSDFMEPVIKYDPLEQSLGAMWDPVAPDPSFLPQPSQADTNSSQAQIWIIDNNGVANGRVKYPTYYDPNSTHTIPVYVSADPNDDSVLYITTSALSSTFQYSNDVFPVKSEFPLERTLTALQSTDTYAKLKNQDYYNLDDIIRHEVVIKGLWGTQLESHWLSSDTEVFELIDSTRNTLTVSTKHLQNSEGKINPEYMNSQFIYNTATDSLTSNSNYSGAKPLSPFILNMPSEAQSTNGVTGWQDVEITINRVVGPRALYNRSASNIVYWPNWHNPGRDHDIVTDHPLANDSGHSPATRLTGDPVAGSSVFLSTVGALDSSGNEITDSNLIEARKLQPLGSFSGDRSGREFPLSSTTALTAWNSGDNGLAQWSSVKSTLSGSSIETPLYLETYKPGSCKLVKHGQFESSFANRDDWCVLGIGPSTAGTIQDKRTSFSAARWPHYVFLFDTKQEKLNTHILRATFEYTWDRDVSLS